MEHQRWILGGDEGVAVVQDGVEAWSIVRRGLAGCQVTCVAAHGSTILVGTTEGVYRSSDDGRSWEPAQEQPAESHLRSLGRSAGPSPLWLAGTEPAAIFLSRDDGVTWREAPDVARLREQHGWSLPYSPAAGCIRGFGVRGARTWAAVEVGGLLCSEDQGASWRLIGHDGPERLHADVHDILAHPTDEGPLLAPTGGGLFVGGGQGKAWRQVHPQYGRAAWLDPEDPRHLLFSPAHGSGGRQGRIVASIDGGERWRDVAPEIGAPWDGAMIEAFLSAPDGLLALRSDGEVFEGRREGEGWRWSSIALGVPSVRDAAPLLRGG